MDAGETDRQILVVDDDPDIRDMLDLALADEGFAVTMATNGQEALSRLADWRPDVILLDLIMPVMDGWTFLAVRAADPLLAAIPVIVMSAHVRKPDDALGSTVTFLPKPFSLDVLCSLIAALPLGAQVASR